MAKEEERGSSEYWKERSSPESFVMFSVKPDGRLAVLGSYTPASEAEEAAHVRDLNAAEIAAGRMPYPNTEWAYRDDLMPAKKS